MNETDKPPEIAQRCRPFGLLDGMLLIAAIGLWLSGLRAWSAFNAGGWTPELTDSDGSKTILIHSSYVFMPGNLIAIDDCILYLLAVVLLSGFYFCVRIRPPRPPRRRLFIQPGVLILLTMPLTLLVAQWVGNTPFDPEHPIPLSDLAPRSYILSAVVGCIWGATCFAMRSTIEAGWIERLGRLVGIGWVGIGLVNFVMLGLH